MVVNVSQHSLSQHHNTTPTYTHATPAWIAGPKGIIKRIVALSANHTSTPAITRPRTALVQTRLAFCRFCQRPVHSSIKTHRSSLSPDIQRWRWPTVKDWKSEILGRNYEFIALPPKLPIGVSATRALLSVLVTSHPWQRVNSRAETNVRPVGSDFAIAWCFGIAKLLYSLNDCSIKIIRLRKIPLSRYDQPFDREPSTNMKTECIHAFDCYSAFHACKQFVGSPAEFGSACERN